MNQVLTLVIAIAIIALVLYLHHIGLIKQGGNKDVQKEK